MDILNRYSIEPFGNLRVSIENPRVQFDAVYGLRTTDVDSLVDLAASGSVGVNDGLTGSEYKASTGTASTGFAYLYSKKSVRYRPGQGVLFRHTAIYSPPKANSLQFSGGINIGNWIGLGFKGTDFGIWYRAGGRQEIRTLTLTAGAGAGETVTVTLNGVAFPVVTTAGTLKHAGFQLAAAAYSGWRAFANGNTIVFTSTSNGSKTGTYSLTSTGATAGTLARTAAGQAFQIDKHIKQSDWSGAKLNGSQAKDPFVLDPFSGNVFSMGIQYLGYGALGFYIENVDTGMFLHVHTILNAGHVTSPTFDNPTFRVGLHVENFGNTSDVVIKGASGAGFVCGEVYPFRNPRGESNTKAGIGTLYTNVISMRVMGVFAGKVNLAEVLPVFASVAADGTKSAEVCIFINPTFAGEPDWTSIDATNSNVEVDIAGTTVTGGSKLTPVGLPKLGNAIIDLGDYDIRLASGDVLCVAAKATSATSDITVGLSWIED